MRETEKEIGRLKRRGEGVRGRERDFQGVSKLELDSFAFFPHFFLPQLTLKREEEKRKVIKKVKK